MELQAEYAVAPDRGRDRPAVVDRCDDRALVHRLDGIRVDEVEVRLSGNTGEPGVRPHRPNLVPSGVRHSYVPAEPSDPPSADPEARRPGIFLALVEEELHSHAKTEERNAAVACDTHDHVEAESTKL